jgi:hypothetical protein
LRQRAQNDDEWTLHTHRPFAKPLVARWAEHPIAVARVKRIAKAAHEQCTVNGGTLFFSSSSSSSSSRYCARLRALANVTLLNPYARGRRAARRFLRCITRDSASEERPEKG